MRWNYWWNMPRSGFEPATQSRTLPLDYRARPIYLLTLTCRCHAIKGDLIKYHYYDIAIIYNISVIVHLYYQCYCTPINYTVIYWWTCEMFNLSAKPSYVTCRCNYVKTKIVIIKYLYQSARLDNGVQSFNISVYCTCIAGLIICDIRRLNVLRHSIIICFPSCISLRNLQMYAVGLFDYVL